MNNLFKYIISCFMAVSLYADQGMLVDITLNTAFVNTDATSVKDIAIVDDTLYSVSSFSVSKLNKLTGVIERTTNVGTNIKSVLATTENVYLLEDRVFYIYNTDINISEGNFTTAKDFNSFALSEDHNYMFVGTTTGVLVVDISNSASATQVSFIESTNAKDLTIKGNYLYLADDWGGLKVVDITNPVIATFLSTVDGEFYRVVLENDYLYTIGVTGLSSFDITSPSAPIYKATTNTAVDKAATNLLTHDAYTYIGYHEGISNQFSIYDVSNKSSMQILNNNLSIVVNSILGEGENIFLATDAGVLKYDALSDYDDNLSDAFLHQEAKTVENLSSDYGVFGNLESADDIDFIKVNLQNGRFLATVSGLSDLNVSLYDSNDSSRAPIISVVSTPSSSKTLEINKEVVSGVHYIRVQNLAGNTGEYKIVADFTQDDWTDTKTSAYLINISETIKGNMFSGDDLDYFRVDLTSKGTISISSDDVSIVDFEIENSYENTPIIGSGDLTLSKDFIIPSSGIYYIKVKASSVDVENKEYAFRVSFSKTDVLEKEDDASFALVKVQETNLTNATQNYNLMKSEGEYLYVVDMNTNTITRKNKSDLSDAGSYTLNEDIKSYEIVGDYIYILSSSKLTLLYKSMNFRSSISTENSNNNKLKVNANTVYISAYDSFNIEMVDISNKDTLLLSGSVSVEEIVNDFDIKASFSDETVNELKTYLYLATNRGLKIYDFTETTNVLFVQTYKENENFSKIVISNPYAYVSRNNIFSILYIKRPTSSPKLKGSLDLSDIKDIVINQDFAYLSTNNNYLNIIDVKDQTAPKLVDIGLFSSTSIYVEDGLGFIAQYGDVTNSTLFNKIAVYDMSKDYSDLKGNAKPIEYSSTINGVISKYRPSEKDLFYIDVSKSTSLDIVANGDINITYEIVELNAATAQSTLYATTSGTDLRFEIDAGEYYLQVSSTHGVSGSYNFSISKDDNDLTDVFADANIILFLNNYDANITRDDKDIVKVVLSERGIFTFSTDINISSALFYSDTTTVIANDDNSTLSVVLNPGTYYIVMESQNSYEGEYTFTSTFTPNDNLSMPDGFDNIKNFNATHIVYGDRYIYIIDKNNNLITYNHLLQKVEEGSINTGNDYQNYCGEAFFINHKIVLNRVELNSSGAYECGKGYLSIAVDEIDGGEYSDKPYNQYQNYSNTGLYISVDDASAVSGDQDYLYEFSESNSTIYKSLASVLKSDYFDNKKPYGIFPITGNIDDIKSIKNDGDIDFIAIGSSVSIYKTNPESKTYDTVDKTLVTQIKPIIIERKEFSTFEGDIEDMYLDRDTKTLYVVNTNATTIKVIDYSASSLADASVSTIDLGNVANGIYVRGSKIYISFANYGMKIYDYPLTASSVAKESIPNIGLEVSRPFSYDGTTFNYLSADNPQVFYLSDSFIDGTTAGSYSIVGEVKEGEGCFIATAAYGSYFETHVKVLRDFRDNYLLTNDLGTYFVKLYYTYSPSIASEISHSDMAKGIVRVMLTPVVYFIKYPLFFITLFFIFIFIVSVKKYVAHREVSVS